MGNNADAERKDPGESDAGVPSLPLTPTERRRLKGAVDRILKLASAETEIQTRQESPASGKAPQPPL